MIPAEPQRPLSFGFLYFPPYRVQGYSIAGEESFVQVPELDVCFDIGRAPRVALTSNFVALTHGHMDHSAGLVYYFSQRHFQGMGTGTVLCHRHLAEAIHKLMDAWSTIEAQRTPYRVVPMDAEGEHSEFEIRRNLYLRAFATDHTVPSLGFVVLEKRQKLRDEFAHLPQEKLVELKQRGEPITWIKEVPLVAYTGDTGPGAHFERPDVAGAKILITECTFIEPDHRKRSRAGKHLHATDLAQIVERVKAEQIVLTHFSRRTHMGQARQDLFSQLPAGCHDRIFILMDGRTNRARYQKQKEAALAAGEICESIQAEGE